MRACVLSIIALSISTAACGKETFHSSDRVTVLEFVAAFETGNSSRVKEFLADQVSYLDNYKTGRMEKLTSDDGLKLLSGYHVYNINFRAGAGPIVIWSNGHELDKCSDIKALVPSHQIQTNLSVKDGKIGVVYALRDLDCPPVAGLPTSLRGDSQ